MVFLIELGAGLLSGWQRGKKVIYDYIQCSLACFIFMWYKLIDALWSNTFKLCCGHHQGASSSPSGSQLFLLRIYHLPNFEWNRLSQIKNALQRFQRQCSVGGWSVVNAAISWIQKIARRWTRCESQNTKSPG